MLRLSARLRGSLLAAIVLAPVANAQDKYRDPPEAIRRILDAEPLPIVNMSPDRSQLVLMRRPGLPSIEKVAAPDLKLGGLRFDPRTNGPTRTFEFTGIQLQAVSGGPPRTVAMTLPPRATLGNIRYGAPGDGPPTQLGAGNALRMALQRTGPGVHVRPCRARSAATGSDNT